MRFRPLGLALVPILAAQLSLTGCDEAEQGRVLQYEKGTYLGKEDRALSDADQEALRQRTRMQHGL